MATGFRSKVYPHGKYFFTSFNRKEVYRLIENFGLSGKGALEKEIPKTFMSLPDEQTAELIAGLFDGDGSLTRDGELIFASTSWKLALQVRNLLLRFGIQTSLRQQNKNRKNPLHSIRTSDAEDVQKFIENIPCAKKSIVKNALQRRCINSKTMKRKTIPRVFGLLDDVRKKLFLLQDEVIPNRVFANYYRSDPSFKKTEFILNVFKNRIDELQLLSSSSLNADWTQIRQAAKKLNLSYEKITRISEKNFSWNYGSKSKAGLVYYQKFFSEICLKAVREALQPLKTLEEILRGDVAFDEVVRIEKRNYEGSVYDLTTLTGNFFANGMLTHNCGAIHRANKGVLFIDEVSALSPKAQQELLTAMQEKKYSITGQSEMSSGAMVRTQSVPCDFVLVAAGNYKDIAKMHPALRNRIRGYGYEIYMDESIADNPQNRAKLVQFIAQEVRKDGKIPHFDRSAVDEIINEARKRSGRKNKLTLKLRELGGLVRAAGDLAREENAKLVSREHVLRAKVLARTLEQQAAEQMIDLRRDYKIFLSKGKQVGKVNGLAVMGDSGVILPIVAEVAPAASRQEGKIIATGKLGSIAKEAVENVSAIIKRHTGKDTTSYDIHIQFLQTFEGVEGDSASVSVAAAVISALEEAPIRQEVALTGSLSVRGEVLPVGGVTQKAEAAIEAGMSEIIVPAANVDDLVLDEKQRAKIRIVPASNILDVLRACLAESPKKQRLLAAIEAEF
jgi:lon-related putative ATP-dependent protease